MSLGHNGVCLQADRIDRMERAIDSIEESVPRIGPLMGEVGRIHHRLDRVDANLDLVVREVRRRSSDPPVTWEDDTASIPIDRIRRHPASRAMARSRWTWVAVAGTLAPVLVELIRKLFHL